MGGFWKSLTKGLGSVLNPTSMLDLGDNGNAALDFLDPGNTFHQGSADRLANQQFAMEYDIAKKNYDEQVRMNNFNIDSQKEAFEYQKALNEQQRQDNLNAVQNRVADLKAAGLSPTLAAGSAANVTPVHAANAPQGVAPQMGTPSDIKVQNAMFKQQLEKDYMQLAVGMLGNFADISRTKAETELIKAQKDRYVQETPIDLKMKEIAQKQAEIMNPIIVAQAKLDMSIDELKKENQRLTNAIASNEVTQSAYNAVIAEYDSIIKSWEAFYAKDKQGAIKDKLENEVKEKALAITLAEHIIKYENEVGVPISAMSPVAKTFMPIQVAGGRVIRGEAAPASTNLENRIESSWFGKYWNKVRSISDPIVDKIKGAKVFHIYDYSK